MYQPMKSAGMVLHSIPNHDHGHINWASPIHSLLLENQQLKCLRATIWHEDNQPPQTMENESPHRLTGKKTPVKLTQYPNQKFRVTHPPMPPNTQDGSKVVMQAIDKWFDNLD